jgi:hypothetical protein
MHLRRFRSVCLAFLTDFTSLMRRNKRRYDINMLLCKFPEFQRFRHLINFHETSY